MSKPIVTASYTRRLGARAVVVEPLPMPRFRGMLFFGAKLGTHSATIIAVWGYSGKRVKPFFEPSLIRFVEYDVLKMQSKYVSIPWQSGWIDRIGEDGRLFISRM